MRNHLRAATIIALTVVAAPFGVAAQATEDDDATEFFTPPPRQLEGFKLSGSVNMGYRWSEDHAFRVTTPLPFDVIMSTVDPGSTLEVSNLSLTLDWGIAGAASAHVEVDVVDLYNRNPTSTDSIVDVDEAWILFGSNYAAGVELPGTSVYALLGKAPKFEKQLNRAFESYGLVGTAMNRMPDLQLQIGGSFGRHFYWKTQASNGNPLFIRDPGLLAGDNGTGSVDDTAPPEGALGNGFPILYDAEVEWASPDSGTTEYGAALGLRLASADGDLGLDVLAFAYQRDLADRAELDGTFYGGDLDIFSAGGFVIPTDGREKQEVGANVVAHWHGLGLFAQYVDEDIAGLVRDGLEVELRWRFDFAPTLAWQGRQLFTFIQPALRYSELDNDFAGTPGFPAPSLWWDWEKLDVGVRVGLLPGLDATLEYSRQDIAARVPFTVDEALLNLHYAF